MKKLYIWMIIALIIILPIAYYLISPIFIVKELQEESPLFKDNFNNMDVETKAEFELQVNEMRDKIMIMKEEMPSKSKIIARGDFMPGAHDVEGNVLMIETDNKRILRFEDFDTINGPALYVYLSSDLGNDDFIDLGKLKATKGDVNYDVPIDVNISKYKYVLVWCRAFSVLFSYGELS